MFLGKLVFNPGTLTLCDHGDVKKSGLSWTLVNRTALTDRNPADLTGKDK